LDVSKCISARALEAPLEPFRLALALPKDVIRLSVGLLPGTLFGELGKRHVRISFSTGEDKLNEALARFRRFVIGKS
jgi:aspartate/methionine/tyrosine aminotransferase